MSNLKGDNVGGLLDNLINKGNLPTVKVALEKETMVMLGVTIVVSIVIVIMVNALLKMVLKT